MALPTSDFFAVNANLLEYKDGSPEYKQLVSLGKEKYKDLYTAELSQDILEKIIDEVQKGVVKNQSGFGGVGAKKPAGTGLPPASAQPNLQKPPVVKPTTSPPAGSGGATGEAKGPDQTKPPVVEQKINRSTGSRDEEEEADEEEADEEEVTDKEEEEEEETKIRGAVSTNPKPAAQSNKPEPALPASRPEPALPASRPEPTLPASRPEPALPASRPEPAPQTDKPDNKPQLIIIQPEGQPFNEGGPGTETKKPIGDENQENELFEHPRYIYRAPRLNEGSLDLDENRRAPSESDTRYSELEKKLSEVQAKYVAADLKQHQVTNEKKALEKRLEDEKRIAKKNDERVKYLTNEAKARDAKMKEIQEQLNEETKRVSQEQKKAEELKNSANEDKKKLETAEKKLETAELELKKITEAGAAILASPGVPGAPGDPSDLKKLSDALTAQKVTLTNKEADLAASVIRVTFLEGELAKAGGDLLTANSQVSSLKAQLTNASAATNNAKTDLTRVEKEWKNVEAAKKKLEVEVVKLQKQLSVAAGDKKNLEKKVNDLTTAAAAALTTKTTIEVPCSVRAAVSWFIGTGFPGYNMNDAMRKRLTAKSIHLSPRPYSEGRLMALIVATLESEAECKQQTTLIQEEILRVPIHAERRVPAGVARFWQDLGRRPATNLGTSGGNLAVLGVLFTSSSERVFFLHLLKLAMLLYRYAHTQSETVGRVALFENNREQVEIEYKRLITIVGHATYGAILDGKVDITKLDEEAKVAAIQLMTHQFVSEHMDAFARMYIQYINPKDDSTYPTNKAHHSVTQWLRLVTEVKQPTWSLIDQPPYVSNSTGRAFLYADVGDTRNQIMSDPSFELLFRRTRCLSNVISHQWNDNTCNQAPQALMTHLWRWLTEWQLLRDQDSLSRLRGTGAIIPVNKEAKIKKRFVANTVLYQRIQKHMTRNEALHYGPLLNTAVNIQKEFNWERDGRAALESHASIWKVGSIGAYRYDGTINWSYDKGAGAAIEHNPMDWEFNRFPLLHRPEVA